MMPLPAILNGCLGFIEVFPLATVDEIRHYYPTVLLLISSQYLQNYLSSPFQLHVLPISVLLSYG